MLARTSVLGAVAAGLLVVPLACGTFTSSSDPVPDGGASLEEAGGGTDGGGPTSEASASDGPTPGEAGIKDTVFTLASGYGQLRAIAASETDVVFIDQGTGGVHSVPITGGTVVDLARNGGPTSVAMVSGTVYWTDVNTIDGSYVASTAVNGGGITKAPVTGTAQDQLLSVVAASSAGVFAMSANNGLSTDHVVQYDLSLMPSAASAIGNLPNPFGLAAYGSTFYWTEGPGAVASATVGTSQRKLLANDEDAQHIAADAAGVYWTVPSKGEVHGSLGGAPFFTLASNEASPRSIAADGTYVYWQTANGELRRTGHVVNGTSSSFAGGFVAVTDMHARGTAVTSQYVVWVTGDGRVLRLHK